MTTQALIFTHVADREDLHDPDQLEDFVERRRSFFEACLRCPSIGIVFVYSSFGVEFFIHALKTTQEPHLPLHVLETEQHIYDAIHLAIDEAGKAAKIGTGPKFVVIGVRELASHLLRLQRRNPKLVHSLATRKGSFTYDSPKYVEAILRIARTQWNLPNDPIVRVDIDVEVNEDALQKLLRQAEECARDFRVKSFWWFSGCYSGNGENNGRDDPVNVHAVRQHWLVTKRVGTANEYDLPKMAQSFVVDLAEIGAPQVLPEAAGEPTRLSSAARELIQRRGRSRHRGKPQVISGAGLIASAAALRRLPPFMNAPEMVVWIDDYLKRRLHEAIRDIKVDAVERIDAPMKQDRFPKGIKRDDVRTRDYFRRLLNGCLFDAAIDVPEFADAIHSLVDDKPVPPVAELTPLIEEAVRDRYADVMHVWRNADYGDNLLRDWALGLTKHDEDRFCKGTVTAWLDYLALCKMWPQHVQAIQELLPHHAYWLFTEARREDPPGVSCDAIAAATEAMINATRAMLEIRREIGPTATGARDERDREVDDREMRSRQQTD